MGSAMAQYISIQSCLSARNLLQGGAIVGALTAMLATGGCVVSPPFMSDGPGLNGVEMMALRGNPYAIRALTPMQRQRLNAYQASHPAPAPSSTWGRDAMNVAMGAGGGYLLGSTSS